MVGFCPWFCLFVSHFIAGYALIFKNLPETVAKLSVSLSEPCSAQNICFSSGATLQRFASLSLTSESTETSLSDSESNDVDSLRRNTSLVPSDSVVFEFNRATLLVHVSDEAIAPFLILFQSHFLNTFAIEELPEACQHRYLHARTLIVTCDMRSLQSLEASVVWRRTVLWWSPYPCHLAFKMGANLLPTVQHISATLGSADKLSSVPRFAYSTSAPSLVALKISILLTADFSNTQRAILLRRFTNHMRMELGLIVEERTSIPTIESNRTHNPENFNTWEINIKQTRPSLYLARDRIDLCLSRDASDSSALFEASKSTSARLGDALHWLAEQPSVLTIQKTWQPRLSNHWSRLLLQDRAANPIHNQPYPMPSPTVSELHDLRGQDEVVGVCDSGVDTSSCYFYDSAYATAHSGRQAPFTDIRNLDVLPPARAPTLDDQTHRKIVQYVSTGDFTDDSWLGHGTHTCGSLLGQSLLTAPDLLQQHALFDGMASEAKLAFFDMGDSQGNLYIPTDLEGGVFQWAYEAGARVHSNSWGSDVIDNSYSDESVRVDRFIYQHPDFLIVFAAGNDGDNGFHTVSAPATAKNALVVGATQTDNYAFREASCGLNYQPPYFSPSATACSTYSSQPKAFNADNMAFFSSSGPTSDGRVKPDVVAPGEYTLSAHSDGKDIPNCDQPTATVIQRLQGTSMSTPIVAGHVVLIRQYLREGWYPFGTRGSSAPMLPSAALLKAMVIHGAMPVLGQMDIGCCVMTAIYSNPMSGKCCCATPSCTTQGHGNRVNQFRTLSEASPQYLQGFGRLNLARSLYFPPVLNISSSSPDSPVFAVPVYIMGHAATQLAFDDRWAVMPIVRSLTSSVNPRLVLPVNVTQSAFGDPQFITQPLATGLIHEYAVCTSSFDSSQPGTQPSDTAFLRVTLVWTDYPSTVASAHALVTDLDLTVVKDMDKDDITKYRYGNFELHAWGVQDRDNNVEQVQLVASTAYLSPDTVYLIRVSGFQIPMGAQDYSLLVSGALSPATRVRSPDGSRVTYLCSNDTSALMFPPPPIASGREPKPTAPGTMIPPTSIPTQLPTVNPIPDTTPTVLPSPTADPLTDSPPAVSPSPTSLSPLPTSLSPTPTSLSPSESPHPPTSVSPSSSPAVTPSSGLVLQINEPVRDTRWLPSAVAVLRVQVSSNHTAGVDFDAVRRDCPDTTSSELVLGAICVSPRLYRLAMFPSTFSLKPDLEIPDSGLSDGVLVITPPACFLTISSVPLPHAAVTFDFQCKWLALEPISVASDHLYRIYLKLTLPLMTDVGASRDNSTGYCWSAMVFVGLEDMTVAKPNEVLIAGAVVVGMILLLLLYFCICRHDASVAYAAQADLDLESATGPSSQPKSDIELNSVGDVDVTADFIDQEGQYLPTEGVRATLAAEHTANSDAPLFCISENDTAELKGGEWVVDADPYLADDCDDRHAVMSNDLMSSTVHSYAPLNT